MSLCLSVKVDVTYYCLHSISFAILKYASYAQFIIIFQCIICSWCKFVPPPPQRCKSKFQFKSDPPLIKEAKVLMYNILMVVCITNLPFIYHYELIFLSRCSHFLASYYPSFHLTLLFPNRAFVPRHTEAPCCWPGRAAPPPPHLGSLLTVPALARLLVSWVHKIIMSNWNNSLLQFLCWLLT